LGNQIGQTLIHFGGYLLLYESFAFSLIYIFCKKYPNQVFGVLFILRIKAAHFPWFYLFFKMITGHSWKQLLIGLLVGHLYIYLKEILPISHRKNFLATPRFM
jgi:hypothetical protein